MWKLQLRMAKKSESEMKSGWFDSVSHVTTASAQIRSNHFGYIYLEKDFNIIEIQIHEMDKYDI
jgi:hypothetical protein